MAKKLLPIAAANANETAINHAFLGCNHANNITDVCVGKAGIKKSPTDNKDNAGIATGRFPWRAIQLSTRFDTVILAITSVLL
ncbi:hypothetical protein PCIT_b1094 [Pseudoalteromonas citrea]|uniref:Uncharacterized protein n=1 Tax=Pseudoalteromonas citrea TaxID=43655 RepID=A0AAD4AFE9_9GAMM|nr:hypothetical protein PCIT_b1094 [Pseudoalteromonas citrea]